MEEVKALLNAFMNRVTVKFPEAQCSLDLGISSDKMQIINICLESKNIGFLVLYCRCGKSDVAHQIPHEGWLGILLVLLPHREVCVGFGQPYADIQCTTEDEVFAKVCNILEHPEKY